jgi:hypothetical protein
VNDGDHNLQENLNVDYQHLRPTVNEEGLDKVCNIARETSRKKAVAWCFCTLKMTASFICLKLPRILIEATPQNFYY